ncbi:hypothetical protein B296_00031288 [Ensete ventricosum]|uniref:Uncharacterized protein n=1 Tax=Ensete ventricosum TaxID=4639 RepID=A0A426YUC6_ENSVE|nr:hypothetical protein B296_00031288 [Ensete ventricosum]
MQLPLDNHVSIDVDEEQRGAGDDDVSGALLVKAGGNIVRGDLTVVGGGKEIVPTSPPTMLLSTTTDIYRTLLENPKFYPKETDQCYTKFVGMHRIVTKKQSISGKLRIETQSNQFVRMHRIDTQSNQCKDFIHTTEWSAAVSISFPPSLHLLFPYDPPGQLARIFRNALAGRDYSEVRPNLIIFLKSSCHFGFDKSIIGAVQLHAQSIRIVFLFFRVVLKGIHNWALQEDGLKQNRGILWNTIWNVKKPNKYSILRNGIDQHNSTNAYIRHYILCIYINTNSLVFWS